MLDTKNFIIGVIHLPPLPGTPFYEGRPLQDILAQATQSVQSLYEGGASGCLIQTADRVYPKDQGPDWARTSALSIIAYELRKAIPKEFSLGIQVMKNEIQNSLAIAKMAGLQFIRASVLFGQVNSDIGMVESDPFRVMEYRNRICASGISIWADIRTRHFNWQHRDGIVGLAKTAIRVGANMVCIEDQNPEKVMILLEALRSQCPKIPVVLAGYTTRENISALMPHAHGALVGGAFESDGWGSTIDLEKVRGFMSMIDLND